MAAPFMSCGNSFASFSNGDSFGKNSINEAPIWRMVSAWQIRR